MSKDTIEPILRLTAGEARRLVVDHPIEVASECIDVVASMIEDACLYGKSTLVLKGDRLKPFDLDFSLTPNPDRVRNDLSRGVVEWLCENGYMWEPNIRLVSWHTAQ